jgi:hypothetical protein
MGLTRRLVMAAASVVAITFAVPADSIRAEDPNVCFRVGPGSARAVRGYTFSGRVTHVRRGDDAQGKPAGSIDIRVEHVYAASGEQPLLSGLHLAAGTSVRIPNRSCAPLRGLNVGNRYLVSSSRINGDGPTTFETAAWLLAGQGAAFVDMGYVNDKILDPRLPRAGSLQEALALVAPDAVPPPTESMAVGALPQSQSAPLLVLAGLLAGFVSGVVLIRRRGNLGP